MSDPEFPIIIYHNPDCGTSRNTVAMVKAAGYDPLVIDYLETGWTRGLIQTLAVRAGLKVHQLVREKGSPAQALGLLEDNVSEDQLLDAMLAHPILVNRPIVVTPKGVKLCRPSEVVLDLLETIPQGFVKEDGAIIA